MKLKHIYQKYRYSIKEDLIGGLLAAIIGLPMGLAFGVQAGLGPEAGIYTAIILAFFASLFGGTHTLISDPTGPMTVIAATVVTMALDDAGGNMEHAWPVIIGTFVLAGIFQLLFGILNLGKYVKFVPYPVVSGFMAGIGIIIITVQLFPVMGHDSPSGFLTILTKIEHPVTHMNYQALVLGGITMAVVYLFPYVTKKVPSIMVALLTGTLISVLFDMDVPVIGDIPQELPEMHFSDISSLGVADLQIMIRPAVMLGALGVIDSLLTSVISDTLTKTEHNSRKTVIGQGIGNILTGLVGGVPGAGATMGTVTNIKAGARSKVSGISKGVFLFIIVAGVASYVKYIPMAVLGGILITIGIGIIDYRTIKKVFRLPVTDVIVWVIVLLVTLFDNLLDAVAVGFVLSAVLFMVKVSRNTEKTHETGKVRDYIGEVNEALPEKLSDKVYVENLNGPLFFGFADQFRNHAKDIYGYWAIIIRMDKVPFLDQSGLVTLEDAIRDWQGRGMEVYISGANKEVRRNLLKLGIIPKLIGSYHFYDDFAECVHYIRERYIDKKLPASENHIYEKAEI